MGFGPMRAEILSLTNYSENERKQAQKMSLSEANRLTHISGGEVDLADHESKGWRQTPSLFALD